LANLARGRTRLVGGGPDVGNRCEQGVLPAVAGLPPVDLLEQVRLGSSVQRRHRRDSEPELALVPATERALGQATPTEVDLFGGLAAASGGGKR